MAYRNKYNVAAAPDRTWLGRTYDSKAEMLYAQHLGTLGPALDVVIEQPRRRWGRYGEYIYVPDFYVHWNDGEKYFVDIKGRETDRFKQCKRNWGLYETLDLYVIKRSGSSFKTVEVVRGQATAKREAGCEAGRGLGGG